MSTALAVNTVYTRPVAKVMISIPDGLLERIDAHVEAVHESRSGFLRRLAECELESGDVRRREEVAELLDFLAAEPLGGDSAQIIREERDAR